MRFPTANAAHANVYTLADFPATAVCESFTRTIARKTYNNNLFSAAAFISGRRRPGDSMSARGKGFRRLYTTLPCVWVRLRVFTTKSCVRRARGPGDASFTPFAHRVSDDIYNIFYTRTTAAARAAPLGFYG